MQSYRKARDGDHRWLRALLVVHPNSLPDRSAKMWSRTLHPTSRPKQSFRPVHPISWPDQSAKTVHPKCSETSRPKLPECSQTSRPKCSQISCRNSWKQAWIRPKILNIPLCFTFKYFGANLGAHLGAHLGPNLGAHFGAHLGAHVGAHFVTNGVCPSVQICTTRCDATPYRFPRNVANLSRPGLHEPAPAWISLEVLSVSPFWRPLGFCISP